MSSEVARLEPRSTAVLDRGAALATAEVIERTKKIREVMEAVMKPNVHYGVIPGTQKPTMYQPGADVLNVTFRIAPKVLRTEDLSTDDEIRYRVTVQGVHQVTEEVLAEGVGECSSNEEKYRWRRPVCDEEFKETAEDRRREKWQRGQGGKTYKAKQIRTSPADVANTVLKMAVKRAKIAMTLNATAASDVFAQDLEDLSEELRESLAGEESSHAPVQQPQRKAEAPAAAKPVVDVALTPKPAAAPDVPGVTVALERRQPASGGPAFWIVRTSDQRIFLRPEDGDGWSEIVQALQRAEHEQRAVFLTPAAVEGQKYPNVVEVAFTPEATS